MQGSGRWEYEMRNGEIDKIYVFMGDAMLCLLADENSKSRLFNLTRPPHLIRFRSP